MTRLTESHRGTPLTGLSDLQCSVLAAALEAVGAPVEYPALRLRHYGSAAAPSASARAALCRSVNRLERLGLVERCYRMIRGGGGIVLTPAGVEVARRLVVPIALAEKEEPPGGRGFHPPRARG